MLRSLLRTRRSMLLAVLGVVPAAFQAGEAQGGDATRCLKQCKKKKKDKRAACKQKCKKAAPSNFPRTAYVSGPGNGISASFPLAAGRYQISATHNDVSQYGENFIIHLWGPKDYEGFIFNELEFEPGYFQYQTIEQIPYDGTYFFEAQDVGGPWTISVAPI
ncbi:MAG: hypothetical protein QM692_11555 [Thermomicrobiales bacterium]